MQKLEKFPVIETTAPCTSKTIPISHEVHTLTLDFADEERKKSKFRRIFRNWSVLRYLNQLWNPQVETVYVDKAMDEILPNLYLGGIRAATDRELLKKRDVDAIVTALNEFYQQPVNVKYNLKLPIDDMPFAPIHHHFEKAVKFVYEHRVEKRGILIHCFMGVSRSVTIMLAYIVTVLDMEVHKALRFVKQRRYCAEPNFGFREQLSDYVKSSRNQVRTQLIDMYGEKKFKEIVDSEKKFIKKHS